MSNLKLPIIIGVILITIILISYANSKDKIDNMDQLKTEITFIQITVKNNVFKLKTRFKNSNRSNGFMIKKDQQIENLNIVLYPLETSLVARGDINDKNFLETIFKENK